MQNDFRLEKGVFYLVNTLGDEFLFVDKSSTIEEVIGFVHRFNLGRESDKKIVSLRTPEGIVEISSDYTPLVRESQE